MALKIEREAFIYLEPKPRDKPETFAQCASCRMWVGDLKRCVIHGSKVEVDGDDSCGYWVDWPTPDGNPNPKVVADHREELEQGIAGSVAPEESGLVDDLVQCHRCDFSEKGATVCGLYRSLGINAVIKPNACCNAWQEKSAPAPRNGLLAKAQKDYE